MPDQTGTETLKLLKYWALIHHTRVFSACIWLIRKTRRIVDIGHRKNSGIGFVMDFSINRRGVCKNSQTSLGKVSLFIGE